MIGGCVVLVWELVEIIKKLMRGTYSVRRELRPLNELAAKAQELSEMSFDESAFDESKYHDLEDAISSLKVEREDAKIQMHDKDLAGIENALNDLLERVLLISSRYSLYQMLPMSCVHQSQLFRDMSICWTGGERTIRQY